MLAFILSVVSLSPPIEIWILRMSRLGGLGIFGVLDQFYDYRPLSLLRPPLTPTRFGKRRATIADFSYIFGKVFVAQFIRRLKTKRAFFLRYLFIILRPQSSCVLLKFDLIQKFLIRLPYHHSLSQSSCVRHKFD